MRTRTIGLAALSLFSISFLFHFSAKWQPSDEETRTFDLMRQPAAWQGRPATTASAPMTGGDLSVPHSGRS